MDDVANDVKFSCKISKPAGNKKIYIYIYIPLLRSTQRSLHSKSYERASSTSHFSFTTFLNQMLYPLAQTLSLLLNLLNIFSFGIFNSKVRNNKWTYNVRPRVMVDYDSCINFESCDSLKYIYDSDHFRNHRYIYTYYINFNLYQ